MGNGHKRIAIFGSCFSGRYRKELVRAFNIAAEEPGAIFITSILSAR